MGDALFTAAQAAQAAPFFVDCGSFVLEAALLARIGTSLGGGTPLQMSGRQLLRGLTWVAANKVLRVYAVTTALFNVLSQGLLYGMVFWMAGRSGIDLGLSFSLFAVGAFVGSAIAPRLRSTRYRLLLIVPVGAYFLVAVVGVLSSSPRAVVAALGAARAISGPRRCVEHPRHGACSRVDAGATRRSPVSDRGAVSIRLAPHSPVRSWRTGRCTALLPFGRLSSS